MTTTDTVNKIEIRWLPSIWWAYFDDRTESYLHATTSEGLKRACLQLWPNATIKIVPRVASPDKDAWQSAAELRACSRGVGQWDYTVMQDAAKLIEAQQDELRELRHLIGEVESGDAILAKREERMRRALCFYAHPDTYQLNGHAQIDGAKMPCLVDRGDKAREALVDYT